jgi:uncharacterized protein YndB with AHSA1/START domain
MSTNRRAVDAPPARVFEVLMDPYAYADWVVGSKRIRRVDDDWPSVGSRFHHTVGAPGVDVHDSSKLLECVRDQRIALEVRFRPLGVGVVTMDLEPIGNGRTRVTMTEALRHGPMDALWSRPLDWLVHVRNEISLRRLAGLAEVRLTDSDGNRA